MKVLLFFVQKDERKNKQYNIVSPKNLDGKRQATKAEDRRRYVFNHRDCDYILPRIVVSYFRTRVFFVERRQ